MTAAPAQPAPDAAPVRQDVLVLGAGPAGLSSAALLRQAGFEVTVLERTAVGATWRQAYDRLTLNTSRRLSALPGMALPARGGPWLSRDGFVDYLERYAERAGLDVRTGVDVTRLELGDDGWELRSGRRVVGTASRVVVATGTNAVPFVPDWPGQRSLPLVHSSAYRNAGPYTGRHVLVVGAGNSGAEIAADLAASAAASVTLSARTPPSLLPRAVGPWPTQLSAFGLAAVPSRLGDVGARMTLSLMRPRDRRVGLPAPAALLSEARAGNVPVFDAGLRAAVHAGRVRIVPAVARFADGEVLLEDGSWLRTEAVVAATGWRPGLEGLVGHLGVLDARGLPRLRGAREAAPGLHFVGYAAPLTGPLHAAGHEAAQLAAALAGRPLDRAVRRVRGLLPLPA